MRVTIREVAARAKVSTTTVSHVLNDTGNVSASTRQQVRQIMLELNYKPDALARSFSSRQARAVALIMPPWTDALEDPYYSRLLQGALNAARTHRYAMLLEISDEQFLGEKLWLDMFEHKRVDGMLFATPLLDQDYLKEVCNFGIPGMLINGERSDLPELDVVGYDDQRAGIDATYYLIGLGHVRIAHIAGPKNQASANERLEGYRIALSRAQIACNPEFILHGDYHRNTGEDAMRKLLALPAQERPTAVFAANDAMALGAMRVAQDAGLTIPQDLSLIGMDDTGAAERSTPALTTFRQDVKALAMQATSLFVTKLAQRSAEHINERQPMCLVERETCAPRR